MISVLGVKGTKAIGTFKVLDYYTIFLPYACDSFANDRMEISFKEFTSWNATMYGVCLLVSWTS
jgi:hypothetical protein